MSEHPIQGLMQTAMENIRDMVDVNTIVGDPVECPDGSVIMPISRVGFGFAAGGSEFAMNREDNHSVRGTDLVNAKVELPFGGGSGGGVSITPIAFLVVGGSGGGVKVVPLDNQTHILERLIDSAPMVVDQIKNMIKPGGSMSGMTGGMSGGMSSGMSGGTGMSGMTGMAGSQPQSQSQPSQTPPSTTTNIIVDAE